MIHVVFVGMKDGKLEIFSEVKSFQNVEAAVHLGCVVGERDDGDGVFFGKMFQDLFGIGEGGRGGVVVDGAAPVEEERGEHG